MVNYLETGRRMRASGYVDFPRYRGRERLYGAIAARITEPVLYLEFGVWQGAARERWSKLPRRPSSEPHGFDSFEGLPWDSQRGRGEFPLHGQAPRFSDPRIVLHKGWFSETLPRFQAPRHSQLVVHIDRDLYSSTACVLEALERYLAPGAVILFDEFRDRAHEQRAFNGYLARTNRRFTLSGATPTLEQAAFRAAEAGLHESGS